MISLKLPCDAMINLIWDDEVALMLIFDRKKGTINKYNVEALILQLFAVGILHLTNVSGSTSGEIVLTRDRVSMQHMMHDRFKSTQSYTGISQINDHKTRKYSYIDLLKKLT